jgi:crotonobetainyl-CoA:carnitine CoA-transferase CaiB-like acyl-CoA transferase
MQLPPLDGIRVLSLAEQYPGPYATMLLADLGADVILVERPDGGDPSRAFAGFHAALARGKRSVALDLKTEAGRDGLRGMIPSADVVLEGFRPGTMRRLGFGYDEVAALNSRVIYVSITGFGQTGPYRDRPAHDLSYQAIAGLLFRGAQSGKIKPPLDIAIGDLSAGLFAAFGIASALYAREKTGKGTYIDVSMTDGLVSLMSVFLGPFLNRESIADIGDEPAYGIFRCKDGRLLSLSIAHEDKFWIKLCEVLGWPGQAKLGHGQRVSGKTHLRKSIEAEIAMRPLDEWAALFDGAGIPWAPVNRLEDVISDPHFAARGLFVTQSRNDVERYVAQPLVFAGTRYFPKRGVPRLGEHTAECLNQ